MEFEVKITGLDGLAAAVSELARAMSAGVKAEQVIDGAKASARKSSKAKTDAEVDKPSDAADAKPGAPELPEAPVDKAAPATPATEAEKPAAAPAAAPAAPKPETKDDGSATKLAEATKLVLQVSKQLGRAAAVALLEPHGAARVSEIPVDKLDAVITAANVALTANDLA